MRLLQITLIALVSSAFMVNYVDLATAATAGKPSKNSSHQGHKSHGRSKGKKHTANANPGDVWERIRLGLRIPRPAPASAEFGQILALTSKSPSAASPEAITTTHTIRTHNDELARLTTVIAPKKLIRGESQLPEKLRTRHTIILQKTGQADRYTQLGRLKLGPKESSISLTERLSGKSHLTGKLLPTKGDSLFNSSVQRIRTRLGLHPELFKEGVVAENSPTDKKTGPVSKTNGHQQIAVNDCADLKKQEVIINLARQGLLSTSYSQMAEQCRIKQDAIYERVSKQIAGYSQRKGVLYEASERARPYLYHIVDALSKYNLPLDLALLPIVESAYQPTALSPKSAAGIWQFIPSTGREYGLQQNDDYDARLDITASTHAAIRFLSGLNGHFKGDWLLALAAYNCGQGAVDAAISRNQAEGLATDFWSLDLPAETQDYVPRLLALSSIFANPSDYGLKLRPIKNEPHFIKVNIDRETDIDQLASKDLKTIAKLANFNIDEFGLLNSAYRKPTLAERKPFTLLLPISNANQLHQSLAYMVQSYKNENPALPDFSVMASLSEVGWPKTQAPLVAINLNEGQQWPYQAKQLAVTNVKPKPPSERTKIAETAEDYFAVHYVDKGESLKAVAETHGISEDTLREANKFKHRQSISLGQRLLVPLKQMTTTSMQKAKLSILYKDITGSFNLLRKF